MTKSTRVKIDKGCCICANAAIIAAATGGIMCHIRKVVKEKTYGFLDGCCDVFAVCFICDSIKNIANRCCVESDPSPSSKEDETKTTSSSETGEKESDDNSNQ